MAARNAIWPLAGISLIFSATSNAQQANAQQAGETDPAELVANASREAFNTVPDLPGSGPFPAMKEQQASLLDHTIYRPADLDSLGDLKLGLVIWGNGGCRNDGASARMHLLELASHGYIAIAPGGIYSGPGSKAAPNNDQTTTEQVLEGLDWALAQNSNPDSPLHGRIDPRAVAVAGHSCGGLQALLAAPDPRIATALIHNSGVFADTDHPVDGLTIAKSHLQQLHSPVLYTIGGPEDVAYPNGTDDFARINHIPIMLVDLNVGHGGTFRVPYGGRVAQIAVDWLEWQLRGDQAAARSFVGPACRLCLQPDLRVQRKKID